MTTPRAFYRYYVTALVNAAESSTARARAMERLLAFARELHASELSSNALEERMQELAHQFVAADDVAARWAADNRWAFAYAQAARNGLTGGAK